MHKGIQVIVGETEHAALPPRLNEQSVAFLNASESQSEFSIVLFVCSRLCVKVTPQFLHAIKVIDLTEVQVFGYHRVHVVPAVAIDGRLFEKTLSDELESEKESSS